jgi:hypothetical protein
MESPFINDDELLFNDKLDCEFAHFKSIELCNDFAIYMKNNGYKITNKCCGGNGCGIEKIKNMELKNIVKKYLQKKETNTEKTEKTEKNQCDICYEDVDNLITKCKICTYPFCPDCWNKIPKAECPYCRSIFNDN